LFTEIPLEALGLTCYSLHAFAGSGSKGEFPAELHLERRNEFVEIRAEFDLLLC